MRRLAAVGVLALVVAGCSSAAPASTPTVAPSLTAEQEGALHCPPSYPTCVEHYAITKRSGAHAILCIFMDGRWSIGTPGEGGNGTAVNDDCGSDGSGIIEAVINPPPAP